MNGRRTTQHLRAATQRVADVNSLKGGQGHLRRRNSNTTDITLRNRATTATAAHTAAEASCKEPENLFRVAGALRKPRPGDLQHSAFRVQPSVAPPCFAHPGRGFADSTPASRSGPTRSGPSHSKVLRFKTDKRFMASLSIRFACGGYIPASSTLNIATTAVSSRWRAAALRRPTERVINDELAVNSLPGLAALSLRRPPRSKSESRIG